MRLAVRSSGPAMFISVWGGQDNGLNPESAYEARDSKVAYLFPGQGAQSVGMGRQLYEGSPTARDVFHQVDEALGRPLSRLLFFGPENELRRTVNAQPAIMAVSLACMKAIEENLGKDAMPRPVLLAGHSLGEFTALAVADVLEADDTVRLVQERGRLMQKACEETPGAMAAVLGSDLMTLEEIARQTGTYISNVNTPEQIVISGERMAVARSLDMALARGARKVIPLKVGGAFHSRLMEPARDGLMEAMERLKFKDPNIPIVANATGVPLTTAAEVKQELASQICSCVQWRKSISYMIGSGVSQFIEVGPGKALAGMVKRIDSSAKTVSVGDLDTIMTLQGR